MAIVNRDLDASQQRDYLSWVSGYGASGLGVATGSTLTLFGPMPYPYQLQSMCALANGTSGAPQLVPLIARPLVGGLTVIAVSISNMVIAVSASMSSSSLAYSGLAPQGSTLLLGQRGDFIMASTAVANTACSVLMVQAVVKRVQDIVSMNGV